VKYIEPPQVLVEKYSELYRKIGNSDGMRITDIQVALGAKSPGQSRRWLRLKRWACCYGTSRLAGLTG
jgi:hypothetical protein